MNMTSTDLDRLVAEEKKLVAIEYQNEVWADGTLEGIEPEIMAEAAFATALTELIRDNGEVSALALLEACVNVFLRVSFHRIASCNINSVILHA